MLSITLTLELNLPVIHLPEELIARVIVTNTGNIPEVLYTVPLLDANLALRLRSSDGAEWLPGFPPMPVVDDGVSNRETLDPGTTYVWEYQAFLPDELHSDDYELSVHYRYEDNDKSSPWVPFTLIR